MIMEESRDRDVAREKRVVFIVATLAAFLMPFMGASANVALPSIARDLQLDAIVLTWVATSFLLATAVALLPAGRIADILGRKKIFFAGTLLYTLGSLFCGLADSGSWLISARVVQGIGGSMIFGTGLAILTSVFPPGERGKAIGINIAAVYIGLSLGPVIGGILVKHIGWRSVFMVNVPLGLIVLLTIHYGIRGEWHGEGSKKFDVRGSLLYGGALVMLMYGVSLLPIPLGLLCIAAGVAGLVGFWFLESRTAAPMLDVSLFRQNPAFTFANLSALVHYGATFGITFLLSIYLQYIRGLDPQEAGGVLVAQPIMMAILSPVAGMLSDKIQPRIVASTGMALTCCGIIALALLEHGAPLIGVIGALAVLGFGFALFSSPNTNAVMNAVGKSSYGIASAAIGTMRVLGQMFSMAVATLILGQKVGRVQFQAESAGTFVEGFHIILWIFAVFCLIGVGLSAARGKMHPVTA
jgi:EmrB/QacA subfamily drug resistance transporter